MILDLDDERATEAALAGAKAAWLARARRAGLPVLAGVVLTADASAAAMAFGAQALAHRGPGRARSTIWALPLDGSMLSQLHTLASRLGEPLVVRSSSVLEGDGAWSGAFASFPDITLADLPTAIRGCWASAFSVSALSRYASSGIEPGSAQMAVLIQPALAPRFGGTARVEGTDVRVVGVASSPAPLLQGREAGLVARIGPGDDVHGDAAMRVMGRALLIRVATAVREASVRIGATSCEWAIADESVALLQLGRSGDRRTIGSLPSPDPLGEAAARIARIVRRAPGPLGEALILPWAIAETTLRADPRRDRSSLRHGSLAALQLAAREASSLTAHVWRLPEAEAAERSRQVLRAMRSGDLTTAVRIIEGLREPDERRANRIRSLVAAVRRSLVELGEVADVETAWYASVDRAAEVLRSGRVDRQRARVGVDRWVPFQAAVVRASGQRCFGTSAAPGIGFGRLCYIADLTRSDHFRSRDVIVTTHPVPGFGGLLWDAAGLVTTGGGPAAHLFEAARSLGLAAACAVDFGDVVGDSLERASGRFAIAVDGESGVVDVTPW